MGGMSQQRRSAEERQRLLKGIRPTNPGQSREAAQRAGVSSATSESLRCEIPGSTASRYSLAGTPNRRQDSITDNIAATLGPACTLPTCSQFLRPSATPRIEFSARLLDNSTSA